jgi:hypothetical protein
MPTTMEAADRGGTPQGPPPEYLAVTDMEDITGRELANRRIRLLAAIGPAAPGTPGALPAALALAAIIAQQDARAKGYYASPDVARRCACGFTCTKLAALDAHMEQFPVDDPAHEEI